MRPDSTSYPTLAAVDACGITDPKVITQVYIFSGLLAEHLRGPDGGHPPLSNSPCAIQHMAIRDLIGPVMSVALGYRLLLNLQRSIKWCEENRK